ncbi:CO dehydrogenase/acetyl-CoA synthase alpha subunit [Bradyrhizobium sp. RT6a]|uniref:hypothetical protein n=1 Tax=Bradyrhizobium sp. RT6a TaxID=3156381 RepID=UPI0033958B09
MDFASPCGYVFDVAIRTPSVPIAPNVPAMISAVGCMPPSDQCEGSCSSILTQTLRRNSGLPCPSTSTGGR